MIGAYGVQIPEIVRIGIELHVLLKELDLQAKKDDRILFHSLYRAKDTGEIEAASTDDYLKLSPSAIDDTFGSLVDREIERSMKKLGK